MEEGGQSAFAVSELSFRLLKLNILLLGLGFFSNFKHSKWSQF